MTSCVQAKADFCIEIHGLVGYNIIIHKIGVLRPQNGNQQPRECLWHNLQPSRYEGKAVTVREAQLLGKPVVITDYATSASQLADGVDGVIVPMDNAGCAAGIAALLRDPVQMQQLSEDCAKRDYTNSAEIEKIYALME